MEPSSHEASRSPVWERRRRRTQQGIVVKAMGLFEVKGYEATTVEAIASAALISARTFYRYFSAKEDLVFHGFPDSVELLRREARSSSGDLFERLHKASVTLAGVLEADREAWIRRFNLILSVPSLRARDVVLNKRYEEVFREAMLEEWGDGLDARQRSRLLAGAIMGGIQTAIEMWVDQAGRPSLPTLASKVFEVLRAAGSPRVAISLAPSTSVTSPRSQAEEREVPAPAARRRSPDTGLPRLD